MKFIAKGVKMKRTIKDLVNLKGKVVLLRVDFNVPMTENGRITSTARIDRALPTIKYLMQQKARIVILSHLGRPQGFDMTKSLWPVALYLMKKLKRQKRGISFCNKVIGDEVKERIKLLKEGNILLLENTRFYPQEEANDLEFAKEIASYGDIFVNDAFAAAHRKNATTYSLGRLMPNAIGFLMEKELKNLSRLIKEPKRPFVAVLGGAKVNTKIKILQKFIEKADTILIGGAMAYTFMYAKGETVGASIVDNDCIKIARDILADAEAKGKKILLPIDHVAVSVSDRRKSIKEVKKLKGDLMGYDIGKETIKKYQKVIKQAGQVFWNGPMGMFEEDGFWKGTYEIGKAIGKTGRKVFTVAGGGDTVNALKQFKLTRKIKYVSTGGGASMEFIEQETLPCVEVMQEKIEI